jgi:hypothetical protein
LCLLGSLYDGLIDQFLVLALLFLGRAFCGSGRFLL